MCLIKITLKKLDNLLGLIQDNQQSSYINSRVVKFIFSEGSSNKAALVKFLAKVPAEYCERLYRAIMSNDMRILRESYQTVISILNDYLIRMATNSCV